MSSPRLATLAVVAVAALGACTTASASPSEKLLRATQDGLGRVRSGHLTMTMVVQPDPTEPVGFKLDGDFAVPASTGELPVARLEYSRLLGKSSIVSSFISTGTAAYLRDETGTWQLPPDQLASLRAADTGGAAGLEGLHPARWLKRPRLSAAPATDGVPATRIDGEVDGVAALEDVFAMVRRFGATDAVPKSFSAEDRKRLAAAVSRATATVVTGTDDHVVRDLDLDVGFQSVSDQKLRDALGPLAALDLHFEIQVRRVNQPVSVAAPAGARPLAERLPAP
jgi:hypothetical protein